MLRKYLWSASLGLLLLQTSLQAQLRRDYTYVSDRRFPDVEDLIGYDFRPEIIEIPRVSEEKFRPGEYSFGITLGKLFVEGSDIQGVYQLNNINTTEYGYLLTTVNARNALLTGHLKVILNRYAEVEALIFRRSTDDTEIIFHQARLPEKLESIEEPYFTDRGEIVVEQIDSLWGKQFFPFFRIHSNPKIQERLQVNDSTSVSFVEEVQYLEKKSGRKKREEGPQLTGDSLQLFADSLRLADPATFDELFKEERTYTIVLRSILTYDDGGRADKTWEYPIKKVVEMEDAQAGPDDDRYRLEFDSAKAEVIYLYLTGNRTISWLQIDDKHYLVRGY